MDNSLDLPSESPLSNSILKNRPTPIARTKSKPTNKTPLTIGLDDAVPLEDSHVIENPNHVSSKQFSSNNAKNDDSNVVFRQKKPYSSNRHNILACLTQQNNNTSNNIYSNSLNLTDKNLFYVTSSIFDDDSNFYSPSDQTLLSQHEEKDLLVSKINQQTSQSLINNELNKNSPSEPMNIKPNRVSSLIENFSNASIYSDDDSIVPNQTTVYLDRVRENSSNCRCADCNSEHPTIAIMSWLLMICKKCAAIHHRLTSNCLRLQSLMTNTCDSDLIDLLHDYGNQFANSLLENNSSKNSKPNINSTEFERKQYIRKKYIEKIYLRPYQSNQQIYTKDQLNKMLYENVETTDYKKTLHLLMLGADSNYTEKNFAVADHAQRHHQIKQMKIILANGGEAEFDLTKTKFDDVNETIVYLTSKYGLLKELLTRYENDRLKVYPSTRNSDKIQRCLFEIDLNNVLAICSQSVNAVSLKCRLTNTPIVNINSQCTIIVDDQTSINEYVWVFPNDLERSLWIREIIKRQYSYHQLIYSDFILLMKLNIQEGINAEKQQVIAIVYPGRFVICSDTIFDEVDLKKYSRLTYQKTEEFTGVILCIVSRRFLYLSSPIIKLMDMLYTCLRQAIKVKTLTNLNEQILTSQNIPVIVERFITFLFEHGLLSKGIYRQAGQESKIKQLLNECLEDPFTSTLTRENYTEHDVANALKRFLRQLDIPLIGTHENYNAWLRSTVDDTIKSEQLIQYYRALLKDLKKKFPIHYSTLRTMLMHIHTVAMLSEMNGMTLSNLISTFAPCLISQATFSSSNSNNEINDDRQVSLDDIDMKRFGNQNELNQQGLSNLTASPSLGKLKRNRSFHTSRESLSSISTLSQFQLSPAYIHVAPSIQANFEIMTNLCKYYRELFDVTDDEFEHERICIETLVSIRNNPSIPRKLDGALVSVYFESRADAYNGYAMYIFEKETTADIIIEKLLKQIDKHDCFFWALFEVIIDQSLERPMYSCENIAEALYRYRTYLSHELNLQATFVVKLNYLQFEKERLQQRQQISNNQSVQCEYFDSLNERWTPCVWIFERAVLKIYRISNNINERVLKARSNFNQQEFDQQQSYIYSWSVEDIYLYIGADIRFVDPFDMNQYRVLTILPPEINEINHTELPFGISFRFADRTQMFSWYLELVRINGHDKWTRQASRSMPDGVNYLPLQNYHIPSSSMLARKKSDAYKNKFITKGCHVASNFCKQLRK
ncbi:unnamed protein product [Rotaria sp. Silwood1]|nr:unnamed protein product [Rotaria sp. Silwood1]CAF0968462.1 unnamed protein product [Rotaria sp. Silwood1]CAF3414360.1 unnamed protein product [Rotaria sp. Silwood1]